MSYRFLATKKLYIRFGEIPPDGQSKVRRGDQIVRSEGGVSVWRAVADSGKYWPILPEEPNGDCITDYFRFLLFSDCNVYLVTGDELCIDGADREPLLTNVQILKDITHLYRGGKSLIRTPITLKHSIGSVFDPECMVELRSKNDKPIYRRTIGEIPEELSEIRMIPLKNNVDDFIVVKTNASDGFCDHILQTEHVETKSACDYKTIREFVYSTFICPGVPIRLIAHDASTKAKYSWKGMSNKVPEIYKDRIFLAVLGCSYDKDDDDTTYIDITYIDIADEDQK